MFTWTARGEAVKGFEGLRRREEEFRGSLQERDKHCTLFTILCISSELIKSVIIFDKKKGLQFGNFPL